MTVSASAFLLATSFLLCGSASAQALEPEIRHKEPIPQVQQMNIPEPVAVPETIGATMVAGVGFLLMFRRRRYS